ncbi:MAG: DUF4405 domain-containing protein [Polyangiaceae bacterium]|nr:DUF4405 domain-containing protein [Polyangiaceae bacterium]
MNRTTTNFWLDVLSLLVILGLAFTGGIVHFVLPPGTGHFDLLFGLGRHDFGRIHFYLGVLAVVLLTVHVMLHWSWVCCVTRKFFGAEPSSGRTQTVWGLALLCSVSLLLGGGLWWASSRAEHNATLRTQRPRGDRRHEDRLDPRASAPRAADVGRLEEQTASLQADAQQPVGAEPTTRGGHDKASEECPAGAAISGRSTLADAARICGMSVSAVRAHLGLPQTAGPNERLGRLRRRYAFAIHDVRRLACRHDS